MTERQFTDLLFLLWPVLAILLSGAGKGLHDAWICHRLSYGKRYALCIAAIAITMAAATAVWTSGLSLYNITTGLSLYRDANVTIGWLMTATYAAILLLPLLAVITLFKVQSDHRAFHKTHRTLIRDCYQDNLRRYGTDNRYRFAAA